MWAALRMLDLPPSAIPVFRKKSGLKVTRWVFGLMGIELHRQRAGDAQHQPEIQ
jgi:hypothetical protein